MALKEYTKEKVGLATTTWSYCITDEKKNGDRVLCLPRDCSEISNKIDLLTLAVGVFFHGRDVKVALCDLIDAGIPFSWINLITRDCQRYQWQSGLIISDRFEEIAFELAEEAQNLFYKRFQRGEYLLKVKGDAPAVLYAEKIMSRRPGHSEVYHLIICR